MNYQYNILESVNFKRNRAKSNTANTVLSSVSQPTLPITLSAKTHRKTLPPASPCFAALYIKKKYNQRVPGFINSQLYQKYSSSQIYYYKKDINSILNKQRVSSVIKWKDEKDYGVADEVMKRFYYMQEYQGKFA